MTDVAEDSQLICPILLLVDYGRERQYIEPHASLSNLWMAQMAPELVASPKLVFVDDSPGFSTAILGMLRANYEVIAAFPDGASVLDKISTLRPDIIILDISLGDLSGLEVASRLRRNNCFAKIIFLTMHECRDFMNAAFDIGASGYVFKSRVTEDLTKAIEAVFRGGRFESTFSPKNR